MISDDTYGQLLTTFDNVEQEEFFEVIKLHKKLDVLYLFVY